MLDTKLLRQEVGTVTANLKRRGFEFDVAAYQGLEDQRKALQVQVEELRSERNLRSREIGQAKAAGEDVQRIMDQVQTLGDALKKAEMTLETVQADLRDIYLDLPNLLHDSVPDGLDEADNKVIRNWGTPARFEFDPLDHVELGERSGGLDFEAATRLTGARFSVLRGA